MDDEKHSSYSLVYRICTAVFYAICSFLIIVVNKTILTTYKYVYCKCRDESCLVYVRALRSLVFNCFLSVDIACFSKVEVFHC